MVRDSCNTTAVRKFLHGPPWKKKLRILSSSLLKIPPATFIVSLGSITLTFTTIAPHLQHYYYCTHKLYSLNKVKEKIVFRIKKLYFLNKNKLYFLNKNKLVIL